MSDDSYKTIKGEVEAINNRKGQEFYGLLVNSDWQNGRNPMPQNLEKGVKVEIVSDPEADFYNIQEINVKEADKEGSVSEGSTSSAQKENKGDKPASSSNSFQSQKSKDIASKVALQEAAKHAYSRPNEGGSGKHIDEVHELAKGYKNIMERLLREDKEEGLQ